MSNKKKTTIKLERLDGKKKRLQKKRLWHRCFPLNFAKFLKITFFHRTHPLAASKPYP